MKGRPFLLPLRLLISFCFGFTSHHTAAWTPEELAAANTASQATYMDTLEQRIVMYCNLARLYPKKFNEIEVANYWGTKESPDQYRNSAQRKSLMRDLETMKPVGALQPDSLLADMASCFQKELNKTGNTGHDRKICKEDYMAENCSFGKHTAIDVVMQLLIDEGVASLGHRRNILNPEYTKLGVAFGDHKRFQKCAVMDFR